MNLFKNKKRGIKKRKIKTEIDTGMHDVMCEILMRNDCVENVHHSCKICYDKTPETDYKSKTKYIKKQIGHGHESILEHSNVIIRLIFKNNNDNMKDLAELLTYCRFLNTKIKINEDTSILLIGGSIRGYKHIIRTRNNPSNKLINGIINLMYELDSCFFQDLIDDCIMNDRFFNEDFNTEKFNPIKNKKYDILEIDDIDELYNKTNGEFKIYELLDLLTIHIHIKEVSRVISQQLTRHRAGITQLSQRYVDYSISKFLDPCEFKENLDVSKKYKIDIFDDEFTLQELGDKLTNSIYKNLRDQGLLKEDARAFLPNNVETSLYMTFTLRGFIKFLELRTDKHAQAELRSIAKNMETDFLEYANNKENLDENIYTYLNPMYKYIENAIMDKISEEIDEVIE